MKFPESTADYAQDQEFSCSSTAVALEMRITEDSSHA
ncbi:MAG: hypothetical protein H6Q05_2312 [Acidobacteria bacterium]|nr:hypothetical protein [Acidobacteriota bacterium]